MPDSSQAHDASIPPTAKGLAVAFLAGFAGILAFTLRDAGRTGEIERFEQVTAVGDTSFVKLPDPKADAGKPVVTFAEKSWVPADFEKHDLHDSQMVRAGSDSATGQAVYRPREKSKSDEFFLKLDVNEYLRIRPQ